MLGDAITTRHAAIMWENIVCLYHYLSCVTHYSFNMRQKKKPHGIWLYTQILNFCFVGFTSYEVID